MKYSQSLKKHPQSTGKKNGCARLKMAAAKIGLKSYERVPGKRATSSRRFVCTFARLLPRPFVQPGFASATATTAVDSRGFGGLLFAGLVFGDVGPADLLGELLGDGTTAPVAACA